MLSALFGYPSGDSASSPLIPPARGTAYRINRSDSDLLPFIPPASWTAHREDRSPCHCSTDRTSLASLAEMDPLIADGYHNLICSPLCRLPEELLLDIMKRLDLVSIQCLRRVSRLFLRLYCSPPFRGCHCDSSLLTPLTTTGANLKTSYVSPGPGDFKFSSMRIFRIIVKIVGEDGQMRAGQPRVLR
jgi:hypothetical protein